MPTKLWKIGECASYGKWRATVKGNKLILEGIDWYTDKVEETMTFTNSDVVSVTEFLEERMHYWVAEKILDWIKEHLID